MSKSRFDELRELAEKHNYSELCKLLDEYDMVLAADNSALNKSKKNAHDILSNIKNSSTLDDLEKKIVNEFNVIPDDFTELMGEIVFNRVFNETKADAKAKQLLHDNKEKLKKIF